MKSKLLLLVIPILLLLCSSAFSQTVGGSISSQPVEVQIPEHVQHASPHDMATEQPLVGQGPNSITYAHGDRPLWEFPEPNETAPLGDIARAYRQQKLAAKKDAKPTVVFEKEGS